MMHLAQHNSMECCIWHRKGFYCNVFITIIVYYFFTFILWRLILRQRVVR